jgi:ABC-type dipeptide/oligopeptide/nickel transport system permease subunit
VLYLFQYDCSACDAQRAHVAELLEAVPASQVVSATAQPASLSPGYWGDLGSPLPQPVGADSAWLAARHFDKLPMLVFVDRQGRIARAVRGSVLTWSEHTFVEAFKHAGAT